MKILWLILGIVSFFACVVSLFFAALNMFGYYNVIDGSAGLYSILHQRMIVFAVIGIVLAIIGAVCLFIRSKI